MAFKIKMLGLSYKGLIALLIIISVLGTILTFFIKSEFGVVVPVSGQGDESGEASQAGQVGLTILPSGNGSSQNRSLTNST